jgi:hypothetical protein
VNQWSGGNNAAEELDRMMKVRAAALSRFGERTIKKGEPLATIEEVLVPLYLHHRYQVEAAAAIVGGLYYTYALRGGNTEPVRFAPAAEQRRALESILATLTPAALALPRPLLKTIPPRPSGFGQSRELFPRYTGQMFDAVTPAVSAADMTISLLLNETRAARLVEQNALDRTLPGLHGVIDSLIATTFGPAPADTYEAEIQRAVQRVVVERLMTLAADADMSQVRAIATSKLKNRAAALPKSGTTLAGAHGALLADDIARFLERPAAAAARTAIPAPPPGAPIGEPAMEWLRRLEPGCSLSDPLNR